MNRAEVRRVERLTPHMIRVVLGGEGLAGFSAGDYTDHYIKLLFLPEGVSYPEPFDLQRIRAEFPRDQWPTTRTYTVRRWDPESRELTVDFVYHGDVGLAGPWAARAKPGDELLFLGPGGGYAPSPDAPWHLLAGDESALPAISASLERLPKDTPAHVFIEVAGPEEEQPLISPGAAKITWIHRGTTPRGESLVKAVSSFPFPAGTPHVFVHGEAGFVKSLRHLLRVTHAIPRDHLSISGYWRLGQDEDTWQTTKRAWTLQVESEQEPTPTP